MPTAAQNKDDEKGEHVTSSMEMEPTPYVTIVDESDVTSPSGITKSSHNCCGCCCDSRRAVIIVNIISISFALLSISFVITISSDAYVNSFDDDEVKSELAELDRATVGTNIAFFTLATICYSSGLYGALKFKRWPIVVASAWYAIEFVRAIVLFDPAGIMLAGFFAYPHIAFVEDLDKGIMTEERYPNESRCCCMA